MSPTPQPRIQGIRWNPSLARYIDGRGRIVDQATVRNALDASLVQADARARLYAEQLRTGALSLGQWERSMRVLIKDVHIFSVAGSVGGWAQLGPAEYGRIGQIVRTQYEYLYQFAGDIASGAQSLGGVANRATLYVQAGRTSAEAQQLVSDGDAGYDEERNVLGVADHCGECPALSRLGWQPRGTLPLPGRRQCRQRCKCKITRRISPAARAAGRTRTADTTPAQRAARQRRKPPRP